MREREAEAARLMALRNDDEEAASRDWLVLACSSSTSKRTSAPTSSAIGSRTRMTLCSTVRIWTTPIPPSTVPAERDFFFHAPVFMTSLHLCSISARPLRVDPAARFAFEQFANAPPPVAYESDDERRRLYDIMYDEHGNIRSAEKMRAVHSAEKVHSGLFRWLLQSRQDAIDTLQVRSKLWLGF